MQEKTKLYVDKKPPNVDKKPLNVDKKEEKNNDENRKTTIKPTLEEEAKRKPTRQ